MYDTDKALPSLPLPTLRATLSRLHASVLPFDPDTKREDFLSIEPQLVAAQSVLEQRCSHTENWLGQWWDEFAYLRNRTPLPVYSNIHAARLIDMDPVTWKAKSMAPDPCTRAALCIRESIYFRSLMMSESVCEVLPSMGGGGEGNNKKKKPVQLCMQQFKKYYAMRVPKPIVDEIVLPASPGDTEVAVIMCKGQMFAIRAVAQNKPAPLLSFAELVLVLREIVARAATCDVPHVGALTCADRDTAANGFELLSTASERNQIYLRTVYKKCFTIVSLDDDPIEDLDGALSASAVANPGNRWYDRATSQIVSANGIATYQGEHSPMDAIVSATTPIETVTRSSIQLWQSLNSDSPTPQVVAEKRVREAFQSTQHFEHMQWVVPQTCREMITAAVASHERFSSLCHFHALRFSSFGRKFFSERRISADFVMQAALQLSYFMEKSVGGGCCCDSAASSSPFVAVYESASTRMYKAGRTECIRSATAEMKEFLEACSCLLLLTTTTVTAVPLLPDERTHSILLDLFLKAHRKHLAVSSEAAQGQGVDRHLMGLRIAQAAVVKQPLPTILESKAVASAQNYQLFTSQMIGGSYLGGFGHVLEDQGYGVCYYLQPTEIIAALSSKGHRTDCKQFEKRVVQALSFFGELVRNLEMRSKHDDKRQQGASRL